MTPTRLAYAEVPPDEKATTAIDFLRRAVAFFERHGMTVEELITDNGAPYSSTVHAIACRMLGIRQLCTYPAAPDQRQSRTLHPHRAQRLGLRRDLRLQPRTHRSP